MTLLKNLGSRNGFLRDPTHTVNLENSERGPNLKRTHCGQNESPRPRFFTNRCRIASCVDWRWRCRPQSQFVRLRRAHFVETFWRCIYTRTSFFFTRRRRGNFCKIWRPRGRCVMFFYTLGSTGYLFSWATSG